MGIEIERKFLLKNEDWKRSVYTAFSMRQGYLNNEADCSIRVRASGDKAWLNIKSVTVGAKRHEFEYEIPLQDAEQLLDQLSRKPLIEKIRHLVKWGDHVWEIDVFEGDNHGLVVAEIELESEDEAFERPDWLGEEVTQDIRYYNTRLSLHAFKDW